MNAKEKAAEIYNQFKNVRIYISQEPSDIDSTMQYIDNDAVIECSIIAINLIIESVKKGCEYSSKSQIQWWERVKSELQPLNVTDKEYKDLMKALYPKDRSKKFRR